ncbi:MAG: hypothetical protein RBS13_00580 [Bacteroidales bacterium]|jgi:hypothetical protein|nr:hypothetical protein [Bacteroidales bacterium]
MEKLIKKSVTIGVFVLAAIAACASLYFVLFKDAAIESMGILNITFYITYLMIILSIAAIIFFAIFQILSDKKQMIRTLILLAIATTIVLIAYFIAPTELSDVALRLEVNESAFKWMGTALNVTYITFLGVILAFLGTIVYVNIKK